MGSSTRRSRDRFRLVCAGGGSRYFRCGLRIGAGPPLRECWEVRIEIERYRRFVSDDLVGRPIRDSHVPDAIEHELDLVRERSITKGRGSEPLLIRTIPIDAP